MLLPNEIVAVGANDFVRKNLWLILNAFLHQLRRILLNTAKMKLFSHFWRKIQRDLSISGKEIALRVGHAIGMLCRNCMGKSNPANKNRLAIRSAKYYFKIRFAHSSLYQNLTLVYLNVCIYAILCFINFVDSSFELGNLPLKATSSALNILVRKRA